MTLVTIRVLEGIERGVVFSREPLPVSIGREEDNTLQLNDDRISRFHAKLQDHSGRVILTDLDSTNGTRVNGHPIQMRVLQQGDVISVGRCLLLFAAQHTEDEDLTELASDSDPRRTAYDPAGTGHEDSDVVDFELVEQPEIDVSDEPGILFPNGLPETPAGLKGLERVQVSDILSYVHAQLGAVVRGSVQDLHSTQGRAMRTDWMTWKQLTSLQGDVAEYLRKINNPES
jgi:FHA domain